MSRLMGVAEQAYRKRDAKASMAPQGGLRPNMRHVQRGSKPSRLSSTLLVKPNPVSRFPPSVIQDGWGGRSFCSDGLRSDINEDHAEHGPAQAYVVKGTKCAIALVAQSDSERWSTEPEVAGSNPAEGTCCSLLLQCTNRFLSHEGGENSINFPRKPCSGFSLLYPAAWVGISHAGQPWWGSSWPSFCSPNGRGMILNINQCGFESCRKYDVRQKVTRKRTNTQIRWYRRPRAKQGENSDERKKNFDVFS